MEKTKLKLFKKAQDYINHNKLDSAIEIFNKILETYPNNIEARKTLGNLSLKKGYKKKAIEHFEKVAELYNKEGFDIKSIATLKMIIRIDVENEAVILKLADLYVQTGLHEEAKSIYLGEARKWEAKKNQDKAVEMYNKILLFEDDNDKIKKLLENIGDNNKKKEPTKPEESNSSEKNELLPDLENKNTDENKLIENFGDEILPNNNFDIVDNKKIVTEYKRNDDSKDKPIDIENILILEPDKEISGEGLDFELEEEIESDDLIFFNLNHVVGIEQKAIRKWMSELERQNSSTMERNLKEIFEAFSKKVNQKIGFKDSETRYNLGVAYMEMGLYDEAINEFLIASQDHKKVGNLANLIGLCFRNKAMYGESNTWFFKALKIAEKNNEDTIPIKYELVINYQKTNETSKLKEYVDEIMITNPSYRDIKEIYNTTS